HPAAAAGGGPAVPASDHGPQPLIHPAEGAGARSRCGRPASSGRPSMTAEDPAPAGLTHVDDAGNARMVDVGDKAAGVRRAVAAGTFRTTAEVVRLLADGGLPKGDALATA